MKRLGTALVILGLVTVILGFIYLFCPFFKPHRIPREVLIAEKSHPEGDTRFFDFGRNVILLIGGGSLTIAFGGYFRTLGTKK